MFQKGGTYKGNRHSSPQSGWELSRSLPTAFLPEAPGGGVGSDSDGLPSLVPSFVPYSGPEIEQHIMLPDWHQGSFINQQVSVLAWPFSHRLPSRADTCHLLKSVHSLSAVAEFCLFFIYSHILPRWYYLGGYPYIIKSLSLWTRWFLLCLKS